jgi:hypothetical protein
MRSVGFQTVTAFFYNNNEKMLYPQDKSCQPLENFRIRYKTILEPHSIGHLRRNTK